MKKSLLLLLLLCSSFVCFAGSITVSNINDGGVGSLRQAISDANNGDTVKFALVYPTTIVLTSGEIVFGKDICILGPGANLLAISGNNASRVFNISGGNVVIEGITVKKGSSPSTSGAYGGGIYIGDGNLSNSLTMNNCEISENTLTGNLKAGGGIAIQTKTRTLNAIITNCTFNNNLATGTFAIYGGAIGLIGASGFPVNLTITNCTVANNSVTASSNRGGGGIFCTQSTINMINCTLSNNSVSGQDGSGGGIYIGQYSSFTSKNSIVNASSPKSYFADPSAVSLVSDGHNICSDTSMSSLLKSVGDLNNIDPKLNGLSYNGGQTQTFSLQCGSPAVNAGTSSGAPAKDQRGVVRVGMPDIGSFESNPSKLNDFVRIAVSQCAAYQSPSGKIWSSSGTYNDTIPNAGGCDSVIVVYLTITPVTQKTITASSTNLCSPASVSITVPSSQNGVNYYLCNGVNDTVISGPVAGNGNNLLFNTPIVNASSSYGVIAKSTSNAVSFNGTSNYIDLGDVSSVDFGNSDFALEAWIKLNNPNGNRQEIIAKDDAGGRQFTLEYDGDNNANNYLRVAYFTNGNPVWLDADANSITDTKWHHVVGQRVGNGFELYLDGVLIKKAVSTSGSHGPMDNTNTSLFVGARKYAGYEDYFDGAIDEVRIWKKALSAAEVKYNYRNCLMGNESNLVMNYNLNFAANDSLLYNSVSKLLDAKSNNQTKITLVSGIDVCGACEKKMNNPISITKTTVDKSVSNSDATLTSNATSAAYLWLDCNANKSIVNGANSKSFTASVNGSYAVKVTQNGCVDTSVCTVINSVDVIENSFGEKLSVYPNPNQGDFVIDLGVVEDNVSLLVYDMTGRLVESKQLNKIQIVNLSFNGANGLYTIHLTSDSQKAVLKMIKE